MEENFLERLSRSLKQEWDKVKGLPPGERLSYFGTYYLRGTLAVLFVFFCLLFFIGDFRENKKEVLLSGVILNCGLSDEGYSFLTTEYISHKKPEKKVRIYAEQEYILFEEAEDQLDQYRRAMALTAQVAGGQIDYMILDLAALRGLAGAGIFCDPQEFLDRETLTELEDRMVPVKAGERIEIGDEVKSGPGEAEGIKVTEETEEPKGAEAKETKEPEAECFCVLSLEGSPLAERFLLSGEAYLAFTCLPERYDRGRDLVNYLVVFDMLPSIEEPVL